MRPKQQKITLSASRDIPFNKLMLSQSNVRHVKAGVSIEELAEGEARPEIGPVDRFQCRTPFAMRMAGRGGRCSAPSPCGPCWTTAAPRPACTRSRPADGGFRASQRTLRKRTFGDQQ